MLGRDGGGSELKGLFLSNILYNLEQLWGSLFMVPDLILKFYFAFSHSNQCLQIFGSLIFVQMIS